MFSIPKRSALRAIGAAILLVLTALLLPPDPAVGRESLPDVKARLDEMQGELDAMTGRIEQLAGKEVALLQRLGKLDIQARDLRRKQASVEQRVIEAAHNLYKTGDLGMLEAVLRSESFGELSMRMEITERAFEDDIAALRDFYRTEEKIGLLGREVDDRREQLATTRAALDAESQRLQERFDAVSKEQQRLKEKLAAAAARRVAKNPLKQAAASADTLASHRGTRPAETVPDVSDSRDAITCPVEGVNSFIDSWGFPRSGGRTHEGTDIMAAFRTPVVAIVDGTITFEGYGSSAGNWLILSGDDGNEYWYMHNQRNEVAGGHVRVGQRIATVGDTGNAVGGPPHVHFEYHPGGGGPVNPFPLLARICR